jgi:hypothetical protein
MLYRIRLDLSFENEADAVLLMNYAKNKAAKAVSTNEGKDNEEISYADLEICRHDEGLPCVKLERVEVKKLVVPK